MTTPTMPPFKEEPGLNAPKLGKKQVTQANEIDFSALRNTPKTLSGYGIQDAVNTTTFQGVASKIPQIETNTTNISQLQASIQTLPSFRWVGAELQVQTPSGEWKTLSFNP